MELDTSVSSGAGSEAAGAGRVALGERLEIAGVSALRERLDAALDVGGPVELDAAALERCDTAGLQLLVGFARALDDAGRELRWTDVSGRLREAAGLLGLASALRLPGATEAAGS